MGNTAGTGSMPVTRRRVLYFRAAVAVFPVLLLFLGEASLRIFDYGGNSALFVPTSRSFADKEYLVINPRIAARYFNQRYFVPEPTSDGFLRHKPPNGYRIFVLGESTTAGWPYPNNVMFTRDLERRLAETFPEKHIEVVNLGIAAINSFTLLDFIDEVLAERPDAVLVYTGHNEFYGALGAASTMSLGRGNGWVRLYLRLQRFKLFVLLRDAINRATYAVGRTAAPAGPRANQPTLMGQVIGEEQIALGSDTYERGKTQFTDNMDALLSKIKGAGVPVIVSELVSNVGGHAPFFSNRGGTASPAEEAFRNARRLEAEGRLDPARVEYYKAKDLDGLRFRAPEEFNTILHGLAQKHQIPVVPMKSYFEAASPHGIIGNELMLEHLHPNARGYQLMSRAFFDAMQRHRLVSATWNTKDARTDFAGFTALDVAIGKLRILHLTDHWPFKPETEFSDAVKRYAPETAAEEIAKDYALKKFGFPEAHIRMAEYHGRRGESQAVLDEFWALINTAPLDVENYLGAARVLIKVGAPEHAWPFLEASLKIRSGGTDTERLLMDLTSAYLQRDKKDEARRVFARLQSSTANAPEMEKLAQQLK